jgi:DNA-binding HxlR family transcriptional regulator
MGPKNVPRNNAVNGGYLVKPYYICSVIDEQKPMMLKNVITDEQKKFARYSKAMGHPTRMFILELLSRQSCCYSGDLTEVLPIAKSTLSQHLKELKDAGLIQGEIEAPKIKYCLNQENWNEAKTLMKNMFDL